jgi:hypothetical protein
MALLKTLIVYSLAILSIIFLYFIYQTKQIKDRNNRPVYSNFKTYDLICPDDYYYTGTYKDNPEDKEVDHCKRFSDDRIKMYPTLVEDGNIDLTDIENMLKNPKISPILERCNENEATFSALRPYCENE